MLATGRKDLKFITGLRGLAALFVLLSHVWYQIWPAAPAPYGYGHYPSGVLAWLTGWLYYGHFGVVVFIVLSGFCLTLSTVDRGYTLEGGSVGFLRRRARRILPPYYCAMAFSLLLIYVAIGQKTGSQWDISIPVTSSGVISHLLLLQDFVDSTQINYVFWSIALEVHLYLAYPLVMWSWRRFGGVTTTVCVVGFIYVVIGLLEWVDYREIPPQFIGLCACFVFGIGCAALLCSDNESCIAFRKRMPWERLAFLLILAVVILCALWGTEVTERRFALVDPLCALATVAVIQATSQTGAGDRIRSILENGLLFEVGVFSYSLYLVHAPILQLMWQFVAAPLWSGDGARFFGLVIIGGATSLMTARAFYWICEKPFLAPSTYPAPIVVVTPRRDLGSRTSS